MLSIVVLLPRDATQSAVGLFLSRPSVWKTLVDCDHIGWNSLKVIYR